MLVDGMESFQHCPEVIGTERDHVRKADGGVHGLAFFFSSRRLHTILQGDWSSDVCSSDLEAIGRTVETGAAQTMQGVALSAGTAEGRSEERRVGKECRSRGEEDHRKKKSATIQGSLERTDGTDHSRDRIRGRGGD